jgi:putative flippase GtrA
MNELKFPTSPGEAMTLARALYENRVMRFIAVGGTCGLVQLSVLHALVAGPGMDERLANLLVAFPVSMEMNFVLSQFFTWRDRMSTSLKPRRFLARLAMFNLSAISTSGVVNQGVFNLLNLFMWYLPAAAIGILAAAVANFLLNDRIVFRLWSSGGASATISEP